MTRRRFFRTAPLLPLGLLYGGSGEKTATIPLLQFYAAGVQYHDFAHEHPEHPEVSIVREKENLHDENAIGLYVGKKQLGYVPKADNRVLAALLDGGQPLGARITDVRNDAPAWRRYEVEIFMEGMG